MHDTTFLPPKLWRSQSQSRESITETRGHTTELVNEHVSDILFWCSLEAFQTLTLTLTLTLVGISTSEGVTSVLSGKDDPTDSSAEGVCA